MLLVGSSMPDRSRVITRTKRGYTSPPRWGLAVRLTTPLLKKYCYETPKKQKWPRPTQGCRVNAAPAADAAATAADDDDENIINIVCIF